MEQEEVFRELVWYNGEGAYITLEIDPEGKDPVELMQFARGFLKNQLVPVGDIKAKIEKELKNIYIMSYGKNILEEVG